MDKKQTWMWDALVELDGETVARLFTDWHGLRLLDSGFFGHMVEEGYIEEEEPECCEDCGACPLDIWKSCPNEGDYSGRDDEGDGEEKWSF